MNKVNPKAGFLAGLLLITVFFAQGCTSSAEQKLDKSQLAPKPSPLGNIEIHTAQLADELFVQLSDMHKYRVAVAGFVPIRDMRHDSKQHPLMLLGHQLEQGLMTEATRRGLVPRDYKTMQDIVITDSADRVFSRKVGELAQGQDVDFFISGTITEQQEGAVVNARVIHVKSKDVVAAATKFFPVELFWQREKVTTRNGMLYRKGSYSLR